MKKIIILLLLALICTSCAPTYDESSSLSENSGMEESSSVQGSGDMQENSHSEMTEKRATLFDFTAPDVSGANGEKLPLEPFYDINWCVTKKDYTEDEQLFSSDKEAGALANAIMNFTGKNIFSADSESKSFFEALDKADFKELLFVAVAKTPKADLKIITFESSVGTVANRVEFGDEATEKSDVGAVIKAAAEQGVCITEVRYSEDVKKTFEWLYGEAVKYEPQSIENFRWRYVEEIDAFVTDSEATDINLGIWSISMQILNIEKDGDIYKVEAVPCRVGIDAVDGKSYTWLYKESTVKVTEENKDELLKGTHYFYTFEKAGENHYMLRSFRFE